MSTEATGPSAASESGAQPGTSATADALARPAATSAQIARSRRRQAAVTAELRAQADLGRALVARGEDVELHGTVINDAGGRVAAGFALVAGAGALLAHLRPTLAAVVLVAVVLAGLRDLDHGRSWLRRLVPRDIGRNVVLWRKAAGAVEPGAPGAPGPLPRPRVVLCLPADARRERSIAPWSWAPLGAGVVLALLGAALGALGVAAGPLLWVSAALLAVVFVAGLLLDRMVPASVDPSTGAELLVPLLADLEHTPLQAVDLCVAVVGGGSLFHDGVEVLLRNHENRLPPNQTTVLTWAPGRGRLAVVARDGRLRPLAPPADLVALTHALDLDPVRDASAAGRALALGWRALGLAGGQNEPAQVRAALLAVLRRLDEQAA